MHSSCVVQSSLQGSSSSSVCEILETSFQKNKNEGIFPQSLDEMRTHFHAHFSFVRLGEKSPILTLFLGGTQETPERTTVYNLSPIDFFEDLSEQASKLWCCELEKTLRGLFPVQRNEEFSKKGRGKKVDYLSLRDETPLNNHLRRAIYQAYGGRCQYCRDGVKLSPHEVAVDHIIPRAVSLSEVGVKMQRMGVSVSVADDFCKSFLPHVHDSVFNYTLSCNRHNSSKKAHVLHPATLELLLKRAKRIAPKVFKFLAS